MTSHGRAVIPQQCRARVCVRACLCVCQLPIAPPRGWFFTQSVHAFGSSLGIVLAPRDAIDFSPCPGPACRLTYIRWSVYSVLGSCLYFNPAQGPVYQEAHCAFLCGCVVCVLSLSVLSADTCTAACRLIPLPLVCFRLEASRLPCGMSLTRLGLCTLDSAAPAFARASASSLYQPVMSIDVCHRDGCVCVCVCGRKSY